MPRDIELVLCDSITMTRIGDLPLATKRNLRLVWNGAGSFSLVLGIDDEQANLISVITTCIKVVVDGVTVWSGPVWKRQGSADSNQLLISCIGWLEAINKRELHAAQNYVVLPDYTIIQSLIGVINTQDPVHPLRIEYGGTLGSTFQNRTRSYQVAQKLGEALIELATIESGCDLVMNYDNKTLYVQSSTSYADHPDAVFENLVDPGFLEDADHFTNSMTATGTATTTAGFAQDLVSIAQYGRCDETTALSDVSDTTILTAYAAGELEVQTRGVADPVVRPPLTYTIKPSGSLSDPQIFTDFNMGEGVRFTADFKAFVVEKQAIRIFEAAMDFDEVGDITITELQTSAS